MADDPKNLAKRIEIFRAGTHTPMSGGSVSFSEADVEAIATNYDPEKHQAPVVVGHPKHDDPAYGWVSGLSFSEGMLVSELDEVDPEFAEAVGAGRFKKVSASFYGPDNKDNPTPGTYYLKHVGLLGAAAPAVKGLKPITEAAFSEQDGDLVFEFGESSDGYFMRSISGLMTRLRDHLIDKEGLEKANQILPSFEVAWLQEQAASAIEKGREDSSFSEDSSAPDDTSEGEAPEDDEAGKEPVNTMTEDELKAREDGIKARENALKKKENKDFVEGLAKGGVPLVGDFGTMALSFMNSLDDNETVEFGEADDRTEATQLAQFKALLSKLPKAVEFGEFDKGDEPDDDEPDANTISTEITDYIASEKQAGRVVSVSQAAAVLKDKRG